VIPAVSPTKVSLTCPPGSIFDQVISLGGTPPRQLKLTHIYCSPIVSPMMQCCASQTGYSVSQGAEGEPASAAALRWSHTVIITDGSHN
ncbi:hypothetical protein KUCAC02_036400, partial [Chaenocephalus aceratus]